MIQKLQVCGAKLKLLNELHMRMGDNLFNYSRKLNYNTLHMQKPVHYLVLNS